MIPPIPPASLPEFDQLFRNETEKTTFLKIWTDYDRASGMDEAIEPTILECVFITAATYFSIGMAFQRLTTQAESCQNVPTTKPE